MTDHGSETFYVVSKAGTRDKQAVETVTGLMEAASDIFPGKKIFASELGSPHAHCRVISIDASAALALPGVEAVMDHTEVPGWQEEKYFVGDPVACVAADSFNTSQRALELIDVEYEVRPSVIDPDEAMQSGAPLTGLWPEGNTNVRTSNDRGDVAAGFAEADVTIETEDGWTNEFAIMPIEGGSTTAWWNGDDLYAWVSTQNVHSEARGLAGSFNLPYNHVHVYSHGNGGGFGGGRAPSQTVAAALALKTGKVVSHHVDRKMQAQNGGPQFATKSKIKIGAKNDGTITAWDFQYWSDQGMGSRTPMTGTQQDMQISLNVPNAHWEGIGISTNKKGRTYYRCVAHPGGAFLYGIAMHKLADALGMRPLDVYLKNFVDITVDAMDDSPRPLAFCTVKEITQEAADLLGYDQKYHPIDERVTLPDGRLHGVAIHGELDGHGGMSGNRAAIVHLRGDGTGFINAGISRTGCGTNSAHCHVVAERLGMHYEDINVGSYGDTGVSQDGGMQAGSTNATSTGAAFYVAASDAREQLLAQAAGMFDPPVNPEDLDAADRKIFQIADPTKFLTHADVCGRASRIIGHATNNWGSTLTRPVGDYPVGHNARQRVPRVSAAEVAVDPVTGEVEILKLVYITDIGRMLFEEGAKAQQEAGIDHTIAQAMIWHSIYDKESGYFLNSNFLMNGWPTSLDLPVENYEYRVAEGDSHVGPFGGTGMGEPCSGAYCSISLAVGNAIGNYPTEAPLHPWVVQKAAGTI
ncbi:xanthine dehydrogenase family protein molybdopterin-binding subunit [Chloroflexota bacterium]